MNARHQRLPLFVGIVLLSGAMLGLYQRSPLPAPLSHAHGDLPGMGTLESCATCHHEDGIDAGCLSCHHEIEDQVREGSGLHASLMAREEVRCQDCHLEHHGPSFPLISERSWDGPRSEFDHFHVDFQLHGKHDQIRCARCHLGRRTTAFRLDEFPQRVRPHTYLGLSQDCASCHEDPHAGGLASDCGACHGQEDFATPAHFEHAEHFALVGPHARQDCQSCHELPHPESPLAALPFPFHRLDGGSCRQCHESPHRIDFGSDCTSCHDEQRPHWHQAADRMDASHHARTGFPLDAPHDEVACHRCHGRKGSFEERHPDPHGPTARRRDQCSVCHEDEHGGQFGEGRACLDCHERHTFQPTTFGMDQHDAVFPLIGAHAATICTDCHRRAERGEPRRFAGTSQRCSDCHQNPHGPQFRAELRDGDCTSCHSDHIDSFRMPDYQHRSEAAFRMQGAHARLDCRDCHRVLRWKGPEGFENVRRYEGTPEHCAGCHEDVHRGQFDDRHGCDDCHSSQTDWSEIAFDHDSESRFPLTGKHREADCSACHRPEPDPGGRFFVRYKPLAHECGDCHDVDR